MLRLQRAPWLGFISWEEQPHTVGCLGCLWGLVDERRFADVSSDRRWVVAIIYLSIYLAAVPDILTFGRAPCSVHHGSNQTCIRALCDPPRES